MGALAPRGWHCIVLYGSNGGSLVITPARKTFDEVSRHGLGNGPAIQLRDSIGGTSGRMTVDRVIARLFRQHMAWVRYNIAEGLDLGPMPNRPYRSDRLVRIGVNEVRFTTPAGRRGLGTDSHLAAGSNPIRGFHILQPDDDMDLFSLFVRLPRAQAWLTPSILGAARRRAEGLRVNRP